MFAEFLTFVLHCFMMVVKLFRNTVIDGVSYEVLIVASCMLSIVLTSIIIRFRPSFWMYRPPRVKSTHAASKSEKTE